MSASEQSIKIIVTCGKGNEGVQYNDGILVTGQSAIRAYVPESTPPEEMKTSEIIILSKTKQEKSDWLASSTWKISSISKAADFPRSDNLIDMFGCSLKSLGGIFVGGGGEKSIYFYGKEGTWSLINATLSEERKSELSATALPELNGMLITGGEEWFCEGSKTNSVKRKLPSTAELILPTKSQTVFMGQLPCVVFGHSLCHIGQNRVIFTGGSMADRKEKLFGGSTWKIKEYSKRSYLGQVTLDGISWTRIQDMTRERSSHASLVFQNRVWMFGGGLTAKEQMSGPCATNTTEYLDLTSTNLETENWKRGPDMPVGLFAFGAVVSEEHQVVVLLGGRRHDRVTSNAVYLMDKNFVFHEVGNLSNFRWHGIAGILE